MGRDWIWGGKSSSSKSRKKVAEMIAEAPPPGCMSGVLHLFDLNQFQFPIIQPCFKPNSILQEDPTCSVKGVTAPRNSLDLMEEDSFKSAELKEEDYHIPMEIRILASNAMGKDGSSESSSSPGPKTPSLVARLMGLDLLPDSLSSPSPSPSSRSLKEVQHHRNDRQRRSDYHTPKQVHTGTRSLPDTPRISSARRSDVVDPRLSLQINKENMMNNSELDYLKRFSSRKQRDLMKNDEENRSPGHYARQIVKQVKESVSRRVGSDITNTTNNRVKSKNEENVVILKSKKPKRLSKIGEESLNSPRLKFSQEPKLVPILDSSKQPLSKPRSPPLPQPLQISKPSSKQKSRLQPLLPQHKTMEKKCKKASCEAYVVPRSKPQMKKQQLPKEVATVSTESTSLSQHQFQGSKQSSPLSSTSSRTRYVLNDRDDNDRNNFADEIRYVSEILICTGIKRDTLISFSKWFSPSHPLDPAIFHHLEFFFKPSGTLQIRSNRKLIFNLVDEMLANIIKPYLNLKPWFRENQFRHREMKGDELLRNLCYEIIQSPLRECLTLEDIDDLIERDLPSATMRKLPTFEESESIVLEIGEDILDSLVRETADDIIQKQKRRQKLCVTDLHRTWVFT
ncbi:hypothetical protein ACHQM5_000933 [Ranunculus cassubicifolius]